MRIGIQSYPNVTALIDTTVEADANDIVKVLDTNNLYLWKPGSAAVADGFNVVSATIDAANGRYHRLMAAKSILTGTATAAEIQNANQITVTVTVAGVLNADFSMVKVTNGAALTALGLTVVSERVVANDQVQVILYNTSDTNVPAGTAVNVSVLSF